MNSRESYRHAAESIFKQGVFMRRRVGKREDERGDDRRVEEETSKLNSSIDTSTSLVPSSRLVPDFCIEIGSGGRYYWRGT